VAAITLALLRLAPLGGTLRAGALAPDGGLSFLASTPSAT
jgi:hypothetical protein